MDSPQNGHDDSLAQILSALEDIRTEMREHRDELRDQRSIIRDHGRQLDDIHVTLRALEPAMTRTAALLPGLVDDVATMKRLLPTMAEAVGRLHEDMAEIKVLLRNGHGG